MADEVLWRYPAAQVLPHLQKALQSDRRSVRYWSAEIAGVFPYSELLEALQPLLSEEDEDMRCAAIHALAFIEDERAGALLSNRLEKEPEKEVRLHIQEILYSRQMLNFQTIARRLRKEEPYPE